MKVLKIVQVRDEDVDEAIKDILDVLAIVDADGEV